MKETQKNHIRNLTLSAVFIALAAGLSLIKLYTLPLGGSITPLSMLPVIMLSYMLGIKWGLGAAFCYSLIQLGFGIALDGLLGWGLTSISLIGTVFLDYILPFTILGLAGICGKKTTVHICIGTTAVILLRFICHLLSGAVIFDIWCEWESAWVYSICYNGSYMLPELIITVVAAALLFKLPQIKKLIK